MCRLVVKKKMENEKSDGSCERTLLSYRDHIYVGTYEHAVRGVMTNPFGSVASDVWILRFFFPFFRSASHHPLLLLLTTSPI